MIDFNKEIIKLDIVNLDYVLYPYRSEFKTLILEKSSEKDLYLLRSILTDDYNFSNIAIGISDNLNEMKDKIKWHVEDNEPYLFKLVGNIDKIEYKVNDKLLNYKTKNLKVNFKTYKANTKLGEVFLVDVKIKIFNDKIKCDNFTFFSENEMIKFIKNDLIKVLKEGIS